MVFFLLNIGKNLWHLSKGQEKNVKDGFFSCQMSSQYTRCVMTQMKDTKHLTVRPLFHWTDQKIKIHLFTCVLAYRMC